MDQVVVVGLSLAGLRAVEALRREGFTDRIVAVSAEAQVAYDRPPLSKEFLAGEAELGDIMLRRGGIEDLDLDLRAPARAIALDVERAVLSLDDGTDIAYDGCILATGASPRRLANQPDLAGVAVLRTIEDALSVRDRLDRGVERIAVVGAGFIGAEVAATCRSRGAEVTLIEAMEQPMMRGLGPELGSVVAELHRSHGVDVRLGIGVTAIEGRDRVERVVLDDGSTVHADLVVVGIGVAPNTDFLESSSLTIDDGVVCDATCLAGDRVVAAGDVCRWPNPLFDATMRLEHWTNAVEQGTYVAGRLLALDAGSGIDPFAPVPYVWSDQYDAKIQTVGVVSADSEVRVAHGDLSEGRFVALFGRGGRLLGALGFSRPRQVMQYRKHIAERGSWEDALAMADAG